MVSEVALERRRRLDLSGVVERTTRRNEESLSGTSRLQHRTILRCIFSSISISIHRPVISLDEKPTGDDGIRTSCCASRLRFSKSVHMRHSYMFCSKFSRTLLSVRSLSFVRLQLQIPVLAFDFDRAALLNSS